MEMVTWIELLIKGLALEEWHLFTIPNSTERSGTRLSEGGDEKLAI